MNTWNRVKQTASICLAALCVNLITAERATAHFGGFIIQLEGNSIKIGQDNEITGGMPNWDTQAVGSLFGTDYFSDLPSFLSLSNAPAGTQALPINTTLYWDFLPMTVNGYTSNLLYWDGQGTTINDVDFGPVPVPVGATDVTMGIYNTTDGSSGLVSDTSDMIAGGILGITNNGGSGLRMHEHNYFLLDDGDGVAPTHVADGVYVVALQVRMPGYQTSRPIFVVPGTYNLISTSLDSLTAAVAWVNENASLLIRDGDYNFDGIIDAADEATWSYQFGSTGPYPINGDLADGNRSTVIDAADYVVWRKFSTPPGAGGGSFGVPEPAILPLVGWIVLAMNWRPKRTTPLAVARSVN